MNRRTAVTSTMAATAALVTAGLASVPVSANATTKTHDLGQTAKLGHFDVTVSGVRVDRGYTGGFFTGIEATVRATTMPAGQTTMRVSWDPWSVTTTLGTDGRHGWEGDGPWADDQFPFQRQLARGKSATGVVPVLISNTGTIVTLGYRNSFGETATWRLR